MKLAHACISMWSTGALLPSRHLRSGTLQALLLASANLGVLVLTAVWIADGVPAAAPASITKK